MNLGSYSQVSTHTVAKLVDSPLRICFWRNDFPPLSSSCLVASWETTLKSHNAQRPFSKSPLPSEERRVVDGYCIISVVLSPCMACSLQDTSEVEKCFWCQKIWLYLSGPWMGNLWPSRYSWIITPIIAANWECWLELKPIIIVKSQIPHPDLAF